MPADRAARRQGSNRLSCCACCEVMARCGLVLGQISAAAHCCLMTPGCNAYLHSPHDLPRTKLAFVKRDTAWMDQGRAEPREDTAADAGPETTAPTYIEDLTSSQPGP
jgi:hypothetical protein